MKITLDEGQNALTLRLEGRVVGPMVDELSRTWCSLAPSLGLKSLVIDLHGLVFIDTAGLAVLAEIHQRTGAQFRADTPLTKYFAEEVMKEQNEKGAA